MSMSFPISLEPSHVIRLTRSAVAAAPHEACGVLLGRRAAGERVVTRLTVGRNLSEAHDQFFLDPAHQLEQELAAARRGEEILGIWHSHVSAPATVSHLDLRGAPEEWLRLIARVDDDVLTDLRAWDLVDGRPSEALVHLDLRASASPGGPHGAAHDPGAARTCAAEARAIAPFLPGLHLDA